MDKYTLTKSQAKTLKAIVRFSEKHGYPPTRGDIADVLGVARNAVQDSVVILARKEYIKITPGISRGIRILARTGNNT